MTKVTTNTPTATTVPDGYLAQLALMPKAAIMKQVNKDIPQNKDYGLPEYIYRCDLIPDDLLDMDPIDRDQYLENAIVEVDYDQGYPTLSNAQPLWSRLPYEDSSAYRAFNLFLDMPRPQAGEATPVRQIHMLCALAALPIETLMSYAYMYYWNQRAQAYDSFTVASHAKMKEHRLLAIEAQHFEMSTAFVEKMQGRLHAILDDDEADISAKEMLDIIKFFIQLQRLSTGAQPFSAGMVKNENALPLGASLEVIMRTLNTQSGNSIKQVNTQDFTKQLFDNPQDLDQAQELIIRMANQTNPRTARQLTFQDDSTDNTGA